MTYKEAETFIKTTYDTGIRLGLDRVSLLMEKLGNPERELKIIHVAGTNGKGSVCAMTSEILKEAGYRVGRFTSPVVVDYREQFAINGELIGEEDFCKYAKLIKEACDELECQPKPSEFEKSVALAFLHFKEKKCDFVVLEVGMGGSLDATNVIKQSEVSVIVNIDYDHMGYLGNTLAEIAEKKAGIIKENGCLVVADQSPEVLEVVERKCAEMGASYRKTNLNCIHVDAKDMSGQEFTYETIAGRNTYELSLLGNHQCENAAVVLEVISCLREKGYSISDEAVREGLINVRWPGRFELVSKDPVFIIDGAHNPDGIEALYDNLNTYFPGEKFVFVTGILKDKDYSQMLRKMIPLAKAFVAISPDSPRAMSAQECKVAIEAAGFTGMVVKVEDERCSKHDFAVKLAVEKAIELSKTLESKRLPICAFGSLYSVGALERAVAII